MDAHSFLCGVAMTLAVETIVLMIATALLKKYNKEHSEQD